MNKNAKAFIAACEKIFGSEAIIGRDEISKVVNESGAPYPHWLVTKSDYRSGRGQYKVPASGEKNVTKQEQQLEVAYAQPAQVISLRQPKLVDTIKILGMRSQDGKPASEYEKGMFAFSCMVDTLESSPEVFTDRIKLGYLLRVINHIDALIVDQMYQIGALFVYKSCHII